MAATDQHTTEIVRAEPVRLPQRASADQLRAQVEEIKGLMAAVLTDGTDYGKVPGIDRPMLYKSGAEWLLKWARLGHRLEHVETDRDEHGQKCGVTYRAVIYSLEDPGIVVATCDGYAGYDEDRYYKSTDQLEKAERQFAQKDRREPRAWKWAEPYRAPWNTVLKMAEKRALVGATLQATATSGMFTQDLEEDPQPVPGRNTPPRADDPDLDTWFRDRGWDDEAEHTAYTKGTRNLVDALGENEREQLRSWLKETGLPPKGIPVSRADAEAIRAKVEELSPGEAPESPAEPPEPPAAADSAAPAPEGRREAQEADSRQLVIPPELAHIEGEVIEAVKAMRLPEVDAHLRDDFKIEPAGNGDIRRRALALAMLTKRVRDHEANKAKGGDAAAAAFDEAVWPEGKPVDAPT